MWNVAVLGASTVAVLSCLHRNKRGHVSNYGGSSCERKQDNQHFHIILFYKYIRLNDPDFVATWHRDICDKLNLSGRVLLAKEGINSTLSGTQASIEAYKTALTNLTLPSNPTVCPFDKIDFKGSTGCTQPFPDLKVKVNSELISTGGKVPFIPDSTNAGKHLSPDEYHKLLQERGENTVVIDVRNNNEYEIGHFEGAVNPNMRVFPEFMKFIDDNIEDLRDKKVMLYCTGGIRCEKASAYLKMAGARDVNQLNGGIHRYLEAYPCGGQFRGKNYVFDRRTAMSSENTEIIGKCYVCSTAFDTFSGDRICTVCRDPVLVCDTCKRAENGVFYCNQHLHLRGLYYYFLDGFSVSELQRQREGLQLLHTQLLTDKKQGKNKRRTLAKQMEALDARIAELRNNPKLEEERRVVRCRTCKSSDCDGSCWGYYAANIRGKT